MRLHNNNKLFLREQLLNQFEDASIPQSALNQPNNWSDAFPTKTVHCYPNKKSVLCYTLEAKDYVHEGLVEKVFDDVPSPLEVLRSQAVNERYEIPAPLDLLTNKVLSQVEAKNAVSTG